MLKPKDWFLIAWLGLPTLAIGMACFCALETAFGGIVALGGGLCAGLFVFLSATAVMEVFSAPPRS